MKKFILILSGWLLSTAFVNAQDWDSVGSGINGPINALAVYNGELYAGGYFTRAGSNKVRNIARWNGTSWSPVGSGISVNGYIGAMQVYNGNLYIGGTFDTAGGVPVSNVAVWNGSVWAAVGTGIPGSNSYIDAFAVYNSNLIAGGSFTGVGNNIAMWNGTNWSAVGTGLTGGGYPEAISLVSYDSVLYVGGTFTTAGGNPAANIAQWNGSVWSALGGGITGDNNNPPPFVTSVGMYNGQLYVGGYFDTAGTVKAYNVARWNGSVWDSAGHGLGTSWAEPQCMLAANGELFVGGFIYNSGNLTVNDIASWNGTTWDSVGAGFGYIIDSNVAALAVYQSQLYAAGSFIYSGSTRTNDIARWGTPINAGIAKIKANNDIKVYPNPSNGQFTIQVKNEVTQANKNIEIYNVMGQEVFSQYNIQNSTFNINLTSQPNGVYLYRVLDEAGNSVGEGKIVLDK